MPDDLTPKQRKAVRALLAAPDVTAAAKEAGCSRDTVYRWMGEPAFVAALHAGEAEALAAVSRSLVRLAERAAATLEGAMSDEGTPAATRVRAADAVLGRLLQVRELVTLETRVRELESRMEAEGEGGDQWG